VAKEAIKYIKRLQNPKIMDDDRINMEDIEHHDEDGNVTTIENNLDKQTKEEWIKKMLTKAMAVHGLLANNFFEVHLEKNWQSFIFKYIKF
jgi:hypothetical protein